MKKIMKIFYESSKLILGLGKNFKYKKECIFVICAAVAVFATIIILCIIYMNGRYINDLRKCIMILDVIEGRERNIIYE